MGEQRISDEDFQRLADLLPEGDYQNSNRGAFYVEYTRILGQYGGTRDARQQVLFESRISTYSGLVGGAAIIGNRLAQINAPVGPDGLSRYDVTLDFFSYEVASRLLQAIEADRNRPGGTGILNGAEIRSLAYSVWNQKGLGQLFPGNLQRNRDSLSDFPADTIVGTYVGGNSHLLDHTWDIWDVPVDLIFATGGYAALYGNSLSNFGFSSTFGMRNGDVRVSADGLYELHYDTMRADISDDDVWYVVNTATGKWVYIQDRYNDSPFDDDTFGIGSVVPALGALSRAPLLGNPYVDPSAVYLAIDADKNAVGADLGSYGMRFQLDAVYDPEGVLVEEMNLPRVLGENDATYGDLIAQGDAAEVTIELIEGTEFWAKIQFGAGSNPTSIPVAEFASIFGSTLGRQLAGGDLVMGTLTGSILGSVALNVGQSIDAANGWMSLEPGESVWSNFGNELSEFTANAAIGSVSSYLTLELGEALGLEGFGAEMFSTGVGTLLSHTLNNFIADRGIFYGVRVQGDWFAEGGALTNVGVSALASAFVSFFATKLGSMVVQPQTQAANILGSIGAAAGAVGVAGFPGGYIGFAAAKTAGSIFGQAGYAFIKAAFNAIPGLGIFVGFILGAFIGNLFGKKKPRIPTANAEVLLQIPSAEYALGAVTQSNGGNLNLVRAMGETARDTLNGLIAVVTQGDESAKVSNSFSPSQYYGHTGQQLWVQYDANKNGSINTTVYSTSNPGGERFNVNSADAAVDRGVLYALPATEIVGGDFLLKRAIYNMTRHPGQVTSVAQLMGDLQIAEDYGFYLQNRTLIDAMIAEPYTSMGLATVDYLAFARAYVPATWNGAAN